MPLLVELPEAAPKVKNKYGPKVTSAEKTFIFQESLGDFVSTGVVSNDQFTAELDGDPVVRRYNNFTINAGHTVTTNQRCKGLHLLIEGDLIINGTLSMTARGAKAAGRYVGIDPNGETIYHALSDIFGVIPGAVVINPVGGAGGAKLTSSLVDQTKVGNPGGAGKNNAAGGGASGNVRRDNGRGSSSSGAGAPGTSFSGGPGGGGAVGRSDYNISAGAGVSNGGAGGAGADAGGSTLTAGGGAGNPGGAGGGGGGGGNAGTGGLIILIVKGNIIINGSIVSKGSNGGTGSATGGGSGGGIIQIFHKGTYSKPGTVSVAGGTGGGGGGVGTIKVTQI